MPPKKYIKKNPIDHILLRPDMYVGSTRMKKLTEYVAIHNKDSYEIINKEITSSPAILRIFVEPLSNAIDNVIRSKKAKIKCTKIKVNIDTETGQTSVWNDGDIVPIEMNNENKCYNHSLIFGQLLTGSNYDDTENREGSGRNGLGVKLTNVFSSSFKVTGVDPLNKKKLVQEWSNNMKNVEKPVVTSSKLKTGYTEVVWTPDFSQFKLKGYTEDIISLYTRYIIDAAMLSNVSVYLNDEKIPINNLESYAKLYSSPTDENLSIKTKSAHVFISTSKKFESVSFVNGVYTRLGGIHVDAWREAILRPIIVKCNKKKGQPKINISDVETFFRIFVIITVNNPAFDGQEKNRLESFSDDLVGIETEVKIAHINKISKWSIMDNIEDIIRSKEILTLQKTSAKKRGYTKIEGLDKANNEGPDAILILCEGLSAKAYAVEGIETGVFNKKGRDHFGILPLRGKPLNVRNATVDSIAKNKVITSIVQAIGLNYGVDYTVESNFKKLKYGCVMPIVDADSVTGDTPIMVRKNNEIDIVNINSINYIWTCDENSGKEYGHSEYEVWSDKGWTKIKSVMRHKVSKKMYRILTHTGCVDVTEDHSLLDDNCNKISPKECKIDQKLLHLFPVFEGYDIQIPDEEVLKEYSSGNIRRLSRDCHIQCQYKYNRATLIDKLITIRNSQYYVNLSNKDVSIEEAYVMGFFFADGTCGIYNWENTRKPKDRPNTYTFNRVSYSWSISNTNIDYLKNIKNIMEKHYDYEFKIIDDRHHKEKRGYCNAYKLIINGGKITEKIVLKYRSLFYDDNKQKKLPPLILNASKEIRQSFFNGVYDGDGDRQGKTKHGLERIDVCGKIGAQGLFYLCKSLGYLVSINCRNDKPSVYTILLTKGYQQKHPHVIKKIIELDKTEQYVYDLETDNHHFQAGIGQMIVHNTDGIHIEGLFTNLIHMSFPSLLDRKTPFIISLKTPIARIFKPGKDLVFYDERKFKEYISTHTFKKDPKYYKGLATIKSEEIAETFGAKLIDINKDDDMTQNMIKVFKNKESDQRKTWLADYNPEYIGKSLDDMPKHAKMSISDFLNHEVIKHAHANCDRTIPSIFDGLKEGQRKVIYAIKKKNLKFGGKSIKVANLASYTSEHTNYHHGEASMQGTITRMAQEFPGTNNIPLLYRDGQFGTRLDGPSVFGSARYIETTADMLTKYIFREEDDVLLEQVIDDGIKVQPKFYVPILPMLLINGCTAGIGTGWSSNIPCYNPKDMIKAIKLWLDNNGAVFEEIDGKTVSKFPEFIPWYRGFCGTIEKTEKDGRYISHGIVEKAPKGKVLVTELPVGMWTSNFAEFCEDLIIKKSIKSVKNNSTTTKAHFLLTESKDGIFCNKDTLKLHKYLNTTNMVVLNENGQIRKIETVDEIIDNFCAMRYKLYTKRKERVIKALEDDLDILKNKKKFVKGVVDKTIDIMNKEEENVVEKLVKLEFTKIADGNNTTPSYDYLLRMQARSFTKNKILELDKSIKSSESKLSLMKKKTEKDLWLDDLNDFEKEYEKFLKTMEKYKSKKVKKK